MTADQRIALLGLDVLYPVVHDPSPSSAIVVAAPVVVSATAIVNVAACCFYCPCDRCRS